MLVDAGSGLPATTDAAQAGDPAYTKLLMLGWRPRAPTRRKDSSLRFRGFGAQGLGPKGPKGA